MVWVDELCMNTYNTTQRSNGPTGRSLSPASFYQLGKRGGVVGLLWYRLSIHWVISSCGTESDNQFNLMYVHTWSTLANSCTTCHGLY